MQRLVDAIQRHASTEADWERVADAILADVEAHAFRQADDWTLLLVQRT
jgi:hypothetical protein